MEEDGCIGSTTMTPVPPLERLRLVRQQIIWLYYEVVPNARRKGHPGPRGPSSPDEKVKSLEITVIDEINDTLNEIRKTYE